ncbi:metal-sulfur cluster assembly factor [Haloparvum sedimenti]|uniref:metal-sulfur cluster assembly factor n=1 Tax=Haloparvum sedimenti TaxID=1678448 RepID=UPI00071E76E4|nr:iron-sulfur cluster assembly protein [Haloparvum sedimenti]
MSGRSADATDAPDVAAVRRRLDRVEDPELARSIVELDYVDRIEVSDGRVRVAFTLPTAWCSPAFAWMMAADARDEVDALGWVREVRVELHDHMHDEEITAGVNAGDGFGETFPDATGGVASVRATLADKARLARQYDAMNALLDAGVDPDQIVALRRSDVEVRDDGARVALDGVTVVADGDPVASYLGKAAASGHVTDPGDRLFLTPEADPIPIAEFETVHKRCRLAGVNMDGQGAVCDALNEARYGSETSGP